MIKDFSKDEYDEFISLFSISNVWHLIKKMLAEANPDFLDEAERAAYIALRLAQKQKIDMKNTRYLVFSALFRDIGSIWATSTDTSFNTFDYATPYDRALSSYLFLKYFSPLKEYSDIVLFQRGRADRQQKNAYYNYGVKLHLCCYIDQLQKKGISKEEMISSITKAAGSVFYKEDVDTIVSLLNETNLLAELNSTVCHTEIDSFLSSLYFRRDVVRNYMFMVTYCFEFYNTETMFHSRMTASLCYLLGRYLNLGLHDLCVLYTAGLFGDIGKVRVPHEILEKPGKLTPEEQDVMRKHIESTKEILTGCFKEAAVVDIAYAHHERLDGSGYPRGLTDKDLSIEQKIMAVADIGSALMAKRSYKDAYPMERTISELETMKKDGKLDPQVVDLFKANQEEIFSYLQNHINSMLRDMQALRAERMRLKFADAWEK